MRGKAKYEKLIFLSVLCVVLLCASSHHCNAQKPEKFYVPEGWESWAQIRTEMLNNSHKALEVYYFYIIPMNEDKSVVDEFMAIVKGLATKYESPVARYIIANEIYLKWYWNEPVTRKQMEEAMNYLALSFKQGYPEARKLIASLFINNDYMLYDWVSDLCKESPSFPFRD